MDINISQHAMTRYAERVKQRDDTLDINTYVVTHVEKIRVEIRKMVEFGQIIYSGRQKAPNDKNIVDVYINGLWVLIVDPKKYNVITLYKIDLNLGDDFNKEYVSRMLKKIHHQKEVISAKQKEHEDERNQYYQHISENEEAIKNMRKSIKDLETMNESYRVLISNMHSENSAQEKELSDLINTLIQKKEF